MNRDAIIGLDHYGLYFLLLTSTFGGQLILCPDNDPVADEFLATTT